MEKVIRNGMVAVLYSPGFGAGWYTWSDVKEMLFHPIIVALVESGASEAEISKAGKTLWPDEFMGGADQLTIEWIPEGTLFDVNEYDGSESITLIEYKAFLVA